MFVNLFSFFGQFLSYSELFTFLFIFFCAGIISSSLMVIYSRNVVHAVLYLILAFCYSSFLLFMLGLDYLAFTYLIVYVGAIAVLFLFVVMMLDLKLRFEENIKYLSLYFIFIAFISFFLLPLFHEFFDVEGLGFTEISPAFFFDCFGIFYNNLTMLQSMGFLLFNDLGVEFILAGFILLIAMVGAIVLTYKKKIFFFYTNFFYKKLGDSKVLII